MATVALNVYLFVVVPKGFFPEQDTGRLIGVDPGGPGHLVPGHGARSSREVVDVIRSDPGVETCGFTGGGGGGGATRNTGADVHRAEAAARSGEPSADQVIARLRGRLAQVPGAPTFLQPVQDLRVGGRPATPSTSTRSRATTSSELNAWAPRSCSGSAPLPQLVDVSSDQQDKGSQASLVIDRDTASRLGITPQLIDDTLYDAFGQRQVVDHLHAAEPVPRRHGGGAALLAAPRDAARHLRALAHRRAGAARARSPATSPTRPARGEPPGPVPRGDALLQSRARESSLGDAVDGRRGQPRASSGLPATHPAAASRAPPRPSRPRCQRAAADPRRAGRRLHRARHPLRELHPPDHDPLDPAVGRRGRAPGPAALRHRPERHRAHRHHPADRHRQEERDHDDRLRPRRRAQRGQDSRRRRSTRPACCASGRS